MSHMFMYCSDVLGSIHNEPTETELGNKNVITRQTCNIVGHFVA